MQEENVEEEAARLSGLAYWAASLIGGLMSLRIKVRDKRYPASAQDGEEEVTVTYQESWGYIERAVADDGSTDLEGTLENCQQTKAQATRSLLSLGRWK